MDLVIDSLESLPDDHDVEIVERKGPGHPDTLCDAIAERICVRLCRSYLDRFGTILHHNVDKVLICSGSPRASFDNVVADRIAAAILADVAAVRGSRRARSTGAAV
jgi:S-adenosylmethionine synthetase